MLDGAWGVLLQNRGLTEADFRGDRFADHPRDVLNDPDLLNLTRPDIVRAVHDGYLEAGTDCITTNSFGANLGNLGEYGLETRIGELSEAGAQIARQAADA